MTPHIRCLPLLLIACGEKDDASSSTPPPDDCGEAGICDLTAADVRTECGEAGTRLLSATATAPGQLQVTHEDVAEGCCPQAAVAAQASYRTGQITATYDLADDMCDCICSLDLFYTLQDIPAGSWTLVTSGGDSLLVTVP